MLSLVSMLLSVHPAAAALVSGVTWTASSSAPDADSIPVSPTNLGDHKQGTPWVEGDQGSGLGAYVTADLGGEKTLTQITVWGGNWYNNAYWHHYSRPKVLTVEFSDGTTQDVNLKDEFTPQDVPLAAPKKTTSVKFKIKAVYPGDAFQDTALSEVVMRDNSSGTSPTVSATKASTTLPPDGDAAYNANEASDSIVDSMWCEGSKGDGTNEWLELDFGSPFPVAKMKIRNGVTYSAEAFKKSNRANAATLTFSDGTSESVKLSDMPFEQTISLPTAHTSTSVKITFTGVTKGSDYNDMCVSEVYFQ